MSNKFDITVTDYSVVVQNLINQSYLLTKQVAALQQALKDAGIPVPRVEMNEDEYHRFVEMFAVEGGSEMIEMFDV